MGVSATPRSLARCRPLSTSSSRPSPRGTISLPATNAAGSKQRPAQLGKYRLAIELIAACYVCFPVLPSGMVHSEKLSKSKPFGILRLPHYRIILPGRSHHQSQEEQPMFARPIALGSAVLFASVLIASQDGLKCCRLHHIERAGKVASARRHSCCVSIQKPIGISAQLPLRQFS